jgi:hypothetical protein
MHRAKLIAALGCLTLSGVFAGAMATPLPIASQDEIEGLIEQVEARRCYWAEGHMLCTRYREAEQAESGADQNFGYYGAPGIYLGYSGSSALPHGPTARD